MLAGTRAVGTTSLQAIDQISSARSLRLCASAANSVRTRVLTIAAVVATVAVGDTQVHAQPAPAKITIGIFAPSVEIGTAQARLAYAQGLAKAIEQNTGIKTEAQSFASAGAIKGVDFAIVDGLCYATNLGWRLLATANIGGQTQRPWALFSSEGASMQSLKGKKLAYAATGCNDAGFIDNAMLDSEVDSSFFGARVSNPDVTAAVSAVVSYKSAQAVFAPVGSGKGLTKVFDTGAVPNPAFVEISTRLPQQVADKVAAAVVGYGGGGAINGWARPQREIYTALAGRLGRAGKQGILANPEPVRIDAKDVLVEPPTLRDSALIEVRHHFVRPPGDRME